MAGLDFTNQYQLDINDVIRLSRTNSPDNLKYYMNQLGDITVNNTNSSFRDGFIRWLAENKHIGSVDEALTHYSQTVFKPQREAYHQGYDGPRRGGPRRGDPRYGHQVAQHEDDILKLQQSLRATFKLSGIKVKAYIISGDPGIKINNVINVMAGPIFAALLGDEKDKTKQKYNNILLIIDKLIHYSSEINRLKINYKTVNDEYQVLVRNEIPENHVNCWDGQFNSLLSNVCGPKAAILWYGNAINSKGDQMYPGNFDLGRLKKNVNGLGTVSKLLQNDDIRNKHPGQLFFPFSHEITVKPLDKLWRDLDREEMRVAQELGWVDSSWDNDFGESILATEINATKRNLMNFLGMNYYPGNDVLLDTHEKGIATIIKSLSGEERLEKQAQLSDYYRADQEGRLGKFSLEPAQLIPEVSVPVKCVILRTVDVDVNNRWVLVRIRDREGVGVEIQGYVENTPENIIITEQTKAKHFDAAATTSLDHRHAMWDIYRKEVMPLFSLLPENKTDTQVIRSSENREGDNYTITQVQSPNNILSGTYSLIGPDLWKRPTDNNGNDIEPCLIKLIEAKKSIIAKQTLYYESKERLELNIDLLKKISKSGKKSTGKTKRESSGPGGSSGPGESGGPGESSGNSQGNATTEPHSDKSSSFTNSIIDQVDKVADNLGIGSTDTNEGTGSSNATYTSGEVDKLQAELDRLKAELATKDAVLKNIADNLHRSKKLSHGIESEERQRQIVDYELKQKELALLRAFVLSRDEKIKVLRILVSKIDERNTYLKEERDKKETDDIEINFLKMRTKMSDVSQKHIENENAQFKQIRDTEIDRMETEVKKIDMDENRNRSDMSRVRTPKKHDLDDLLYKSEPGRRPKRTKRKNKKAKDKVKRSNNKHDKQSGETQIKRY